MTPLRIVVITDLDGTLLDAESYSCEASLPAVRELKARGIPLVLCSSKTRSEIMVWRQTLGLGDPFIAENGGAIYFSPQYFSFPVPGAIAKGALSVVEFGADVASLRVALARAAHIVGARVRSFGAMSDAEVARLTGLAPEMAALAREREYDEPFVVEAGDPERLVALLRGRGFAVTFGGRLFHVARGHDKGKAVRSLLELYRRRDGSLTSVGLGNSANDLPLLKEVDLPVAVKNIDGSHDGEILRHLPGVERANGVGPEGWREAIERVLSRSGKFS